VVGTIQSVNASLGTIALPPPITAVACTGPVTATDTDGGHLAFEARAERPLTDDGRRAVEGAIETAWNGGYTVTYFPAGYPTGPEVY
jgi:hypothetical protein